MRIADIMTRDVRVISPDRSVRDAARLMDELNVGVLPVCDGRRLVGMITDRDITVRATAAGEDPDKTRVHEIMTDEVRWCFEDDPVEELERQMSDVQIRRIPVVDRRRRLVGIVSLGDLAADRAPGAGDTLRRISEPSEPDRSGTLTTRRADVTRGYGWPRRFRDEAAMAGARDREGDPYRGRRDPRGGFGGSQAGHSGGGFATGGHGGGFRPAYPEGAGDGPRAAAGFRYGGEGGRGEHRGRGPKGYTRSDDRIQDDVCSRLTDDPWIDASDIEVSVANGEVTLSGTVDSRDDKRRAEDIADAVSGVTNVQNDLRVQPGRRQGAAMAAAEAAT